MKNKTEKLKGQIVTDELLKLLEKIDKTDLLTMYFLYRNKIA